jgi:DEAD/DEAH box helicase domain-containing protein
MRKGIFYMSDIAENFRPKQKLLDHIVVDVEIQKTIEETPGGWAATDKLGVSCAVVYEYLTDRFRVYGSQDVEELKSRLLRADKISGFNIWRFDYPVIFGLPSRERVESLRLKTNDILVRIWRSLGLDTEVFSAAHKGWSLDNICKGTFFGVGKVGYGGDAPKWFQQGQYGKLINYCVDDVTLERDLTDFVDKYGFVCNTKTETVLRIDQDNWTP